MPPLPFNPTILSTGGLTLQQTAPSLIHLTLSRPSSLNALLPSTFHALHHVLDTLQNPPATPPYYILLSAIGRAFSAGGDVRSLRATLQPTLPNSSDRVRAAAHVLATEYDLLHRWAALKGSHIVTVAFGNGLAFGAGAGLFQACAVRLVTHNFAMAMPEIKIGLIPDCGATRFYARLPGCVGMYLALTGARVSARDAFELALADGPVPSDWSADALAQAEGQVSEKRVSDCFVHADTLGDRTELADADSDMRRGIDAVFSTGGVTEIVDALRKRAPLESWAADAVNGIEAGAPRAVRETFEVMKRAYAASGEGLREALDRELEVESRLAAAEDFEEGVRAALVDKDGKPKWIPVQEGVGK